MASIITRGVTLAFGYTYPAYKCFKTVESGNPDVEQLRFWCQYWIIIAIVTVLERLADTFISWLPLYTEAKLAFMVYMWHPKTQGTTDVYSTLLKPFVSKHESDIDQKLGNLRKRLVELAVLYGQQVSVYVQSRFFEILQFISSQSPSARSQPGSAAAQFSPPPPQPSYQPPPGYYQSPLPQPGYQAQPSAPPAPPGLWPPPPLPSGLHHQAFHGEEEETEFELLNAEELPPSVSTSVPVPAVSIHKQGIYNMRGRRRISWMQQ